MILFYVLLGTFTVIVLSLLVIFVSTQERRYDSLVTVMKESHESYQFMGQYHYWFRTQLEKYKTCFFDINVFQDYSGTVDGYKNILRERLLPKERRFSLSQTMLLDLFYKGDLCLVTLGFGILGDNVGESKKFLSQEKISFEDHSKLRIFYSKIRKLIHLLPQVPIGEDFIDEMEAEGENELITEILAKNAKTVLV